MNGILNNIPLALARSQAVLKIIDGVTGTLANSTLGVIAIVSHRISSLTRC